LPFLNRRASALSGAGAKSFALALKQRLPQRIFDEATITEKKINIQLN